MESDLIYRSEAIDALLKQPNTPTPSVIRRVLRQVPTVEAVEVVRCKDCKNSFEDDFDGSLWCCRDVEREVVDNHFCSYGERRAEDVAD